MIVGAVQRSLHSTASLLHILDDFTHMFRKLCQLPFAVSDRMGSLELPRLKPRLVLSDCASTEGCTLTIDGLWALEFGNAGSNGSPDTLFFTAGPDEESHGLFGTITTG